MSTPKDTSISNTGYSDRWTSPCCYAEMGDAGEGVHDCPSCGRKIRCTRDTQPVCTAELVEAEEDEAA